MVTSLLNPRDQAARVSLSEQNTALSRRLQATESALEAVFRRLNTPEKHAGQPQPAAGLERRLTELSENVRNIEQKCHDSLRSTTKLVNALTRRANETDGQVKSLFADLKTATDPLAGLALTNFEPFGECPRG
jgi:hypothetical protein